MTPNLEHAVERVTGDKEASYGTCFCVAVRDSSALYLTCAHVIQKVLLANPPRSNLKNLVVKVGEKDATVFRSAGTSCDLVLLEVTPAPGRARPLPLVNGVRQGTPFQGFGFQEGGRTVSIKMVEGSVAYRTLEVSSEKYHRLVLAAEKRRFSFGMSGGPVLDPEGRVMGMLTQTEEASGGAALEVGAALTRLWPDLGIVSHNVSEMGAQSLSKAPVILPSLLPYQADRILPKDRLLQIFLEKDGPLVMARVLGPESAEHDMFLRVFGHEYLELPEPNRFELDCHATVNGFHKDLHDKVFGKPLEIGGGKAPALQEITDGLPEGKVLILVDGGVGQMRNPYLDALKNWLMLWQKLEWRARRDVVVGVALRFYDPEGPIARRAWTQVRNWLLKARIASTLGRIKELRDIGYLEVVRRSDMNRWIDMAEKKWLKREFIDYKDDLRFRINRIFDTEGGALPMRVLAEELHRLLDDYAQELTPRRR